jgi:hypothetical protein
MVQAWVLIGIVCIGVSVSVLLERKRRAAVKAFQTSASRIVSRAGTIEHALHQGFDRLQAHFDSLQPRRASGAGSLVEVAEMIVYTKLRVKTFYDPYRGEFLSFAEPPQFLASAAVEIEETDFKALLALKQKHQEEDERIGPLLRAGQGGYQKIIPLRRSSG